MSTDDEWEAWGRKDPYFGVLTHEKFRSSALDEDALAEFFASGENDIEAALVTVRKHIDSDFSPKRAVDFGCGVGRLVVPLALRCDEVVGIDVSPAMLAEARQNCEARSITNATFVRSDDELSELSGSFDFLHSLIVFQHIPSQRAAAVFEHLVAHLVVGGVGVVHFVIGEQKGGTRNRQALIDDVAKRLRTTPVWRLARRRFREDPEIQMNSIDLNRVFLILDSCGVSAAYVELREHGDYRAATVFFQRTE